MLNPTSIIRFLLRGPSALESRAARWTVLALAATGAAFLVWSAVIHLELWGDGYSDISVIGPLFLAQGIGCIVLAVAIVAFRSAGAAGGRGGGGRRDRRRPAAHRPRGAVRLHREPVGPVRDAVPRGRVHRRLRAAAGDRAARAGRARPDGRQHSPGVPAAGSVSGGRALGADRYGAGQRPLNCPSTTTLSAPGRRLTGSAPRSGQVGWTGGQTADSGCTAGTGTAAGGRGDAGPVMGGRRHRDRDRGRGGGRDRGRPRRARAGGGTAGGARASVRNRSRPRETTRLRYGNVAP